MEDLVKLKKFNTLEEANTVVELLEKNNIVIKLEREEQTEDITFAGNTFTHPFSVHVKPEDLETAQNLIGEIEEVNVDKLEADYYLFEFTDEELLDILKKPDEWSLNDFHWAQEILSQRGKAPDKSQLEIWQKERLESLSQPIDSSTRNINSAYVLCFLGGFIGILMGRHLNSFKKTLPNGQKVYMYTDESRKIGRKIAYFGTVCLIAEFILIMIYLAL